MAFIITMHGEMDIFDDVCSADEEEVVDRIHEMPEIYPSSECLLKQYRIQVTVTSIIQKFFSAITKQDFLD